MFCQRTVVRVLLFVHSVCEARALRHTGAEVDVTQTTVLWRIGRLLQLRADKTSHRNKSPLISLRVLTIFLSTLENARVLPTCSDEKVLEIIVCLYAIGCAEDLITAIGSRPLDASIVLVDI